MSSLSKPRRKKERKDTHIILLLDVNLPLILPHAKLLLAAHLPHPPVVSLIADRGGWRENKGSSDDDGHEGQAEEQKRALLQHDAVTRGDTAGLGGRAELAVLEDTHGQDIELFVAKSGKANR
jgi:hypothetical protein